MKHCDIYTDFIILTIHVFRDSQLNVHSSFIKSYMVLGCYQMTRGKTCEEFMKIIKLLRIMNMCSSQSTVLFHQKDILLFCVRFLGLRMKGQQRLPLFSRLHHIQKLISIWQVLGRSSFTIYVIVYKQCSHQYYSIFYAISLIQSIHIIPCLIRLVLGKNNCNWLINKAQLLLLLLSLSYNSKTVSRVDSGTTRIRC